MSEFYTIREVKSSQKRRTCAECRHPIDVGQPYRSCSGKDEGEFWTMDVHADCQTWASAVIHDGGDGRGLLCQEDPADDFEQEDLADRVRANPPSAAVRARLPACWLKVVDDTLASPRDGSEPKGGGE